VCVVGGDEVLIKHLCLPVAMNKIMPISKICNHNYAYVHPKKDYGDVHIL
jgi:hypothetical protein